MVANKAGVTVSCDFNYRAKLWKWGKTAPEVMSALVQYVDIGIANKEDCRKSPGISVAVDVHSGALDTKKYEALTKKVLAIFPCMTRMSVALRESPRADGNGWAASASAISTGPGSRTSKNS